MIKAKVTCDAYDCSAELEIEDVNSSEVEISDAGWEEDPDSDDSHYCKSCWPECEKEIKARNE